MRWRCLTNGTVVSVSVGITALLVASFLLGLLRDLLIARELGGGWLADVLFVALILPVFFENLLGIALRDAAIPYLRAMSQRGVEAYRHAARTLYAGTAVVSTAVSVVVALAAALLLALLVPGWTAAQREAALPAFVAGAVLIGIQTVLYMQTAVLNCENEFVLPNWRTVLINAAAITALVLSPGSVAFVVGSMVAAQILWLAVMHWRVAGHLSGTAVRSPRPERGFVAADLVPLALATAAQQLCVLGERWFGSSLPEGSITLLSLAFRLCTIPQTLFALSVLAVFYPAIARHWLAGDRQELTLTMRRVQAIALAFMVPAALLLVAAAHPVIEILLQRGAFDAAQTARTVPLVAAYAAGLPAMGLALLWGRALVAQQATSSFMLSATVMAALTLAFDAILYRPFGATGLAAAMSIGAWLQAAMCAWMLHRRSPGAVDAGSLARWAAAAATAAVALATLPSGGGWVQLILQGLVLSITLAAALWMLGERALFERQFWSVRRNP